ncbi:MAG: cytochrome c biogenesis CcdA family protein [Parvibaculaceae bacterium]
MAATFLTAFFGGLLSFLSPCVLPLVPPYLCFITGATLDDLTEKTTLSRNRTVLAALAFVLGFSTVFVLLGATASAAGQFIREHLPLLARLAGIFIILMGLHFLGLFRFALLNREKRYRQETRPAGLVGAYAVGLAFAFGWTPCIGPVLATILAVAAAEESVGRGAVLLAVYSLGLGVPFLLAALGVGTFLAFLKRFARHLGMVEKAMGVLLVLAGLAFLTGLHQSFAYWLLETFPVFSTIG